MPRIHPSGLRRTLYQRAECYLKVASTGSYDEYGQAHDREIMAVLQGTLTAPKPADLELMGPEIEFVFSTLQSLPPEAQPPHTISHGCRVIIGTDAFLLEKVSFGLPTVGGTERFTRLGLVLDRSVGAASNTGPTGGGGRG